MSRLLRASSVRWLVLACCLAACGDVTVASPTSVPSSDGSGSAPPEASGPAPIVIPAPGSDSRLYEPNPASIVVAMDPGHGGCLDWGVPDPSQRGEEYAEKTMTLGIGRALRDLLEADGITVVMMRDEDVALAGDDYPALGCNGPPWRDANGDGESGFDPEGATRTRDELQARLDVANLVGADVLLSIHINSPFDGGQTVEIAFTESFYTDETPWGPATARLGELVQAGVVADLGAIVDYERGDRGITAHNFYIVAPPLLEPTAERPDPRKQPTRGAFMPAVLSEVGSITLRAEQDLLVTGGGQAAVANGLFDGLRVYFGDRPLAARVELADAPRASMPAAVDGDGPPFWAPIRRPGGTRLRLTNTGTDAWPSGIELVAGWADSDDPYLAVAPDDLQPIDVEVPALAPGASIELNAGLEAPRVDGRQIVWLTLDIDGATLADLGSPALQLASE